MTKTHSGKIPTSFTAPLGLAAFSLLVGLLTTLLGWRAQHFVSTHPDPYAYEAMGRSVLHGEGFRAYGSVLNRRGPLYPLFIALIYFVFGERAFALQFAQCVLLAGICVLAWDTGRRLFNPRAGWIAGLCCALHPALLRYVPDFHVEILLTFLWTLTIWRTVLFLERPTPVRAASIGICCGLAALAKAVFVLYPLVFAIAWLAFLRKPSKTQTRKENASNVEPADASTPEVNSAEVKPVGTKPAETPNFTARDYEARSFQSRAWLLACLFVAMGGVVLPWTLRNHRVSGHWVLITTGLGDSYLRGLIFSKPAYATLRLPPYTDAENECNAYFRGLCRAQNTVWERNDIESDHILTQAAKTSLLTDPAGLARKFAVGLFTFWYQMTSRANSLITGLLTLFFGLLALLGWQRARREHKPVWPLALPILYLNVLLAALLALGRYSVPVLPCLVTLAAYGMDGLLPPAKFMENDNL